MKRHLSTEDLESIASRAQTPQDEGYKPRPKWQTVFAMILAIVVFLAFLGTCYWMIFGRF